MNTGKITYFFRQLGLMHALDKIRFNYSLYKNKDKNKAFLSKHPNVVLPPDYIMYEAFQLNYQKYYYGGKETALWLKEQFEKFDNLQGKRILDWGCGPARTARHLPEVIGGNCSFYGTDANKKTIKWCSQYLKNITFSNNTINPPISYPSNYFDILYGISIFTHLSEKNHKDWITELVRILNPGGLVLLTTQGEACKAKLTNSEITRFDKGELITRGKAEEGHRVYSAFHPPSYMIDLYASAGLKVLEHIPGKKKEWGIEQDTWILRRD